MKRFVVASKNKGKLKEIEEILNIFPFQVVSMEEIGFNEDIEETGTTFEENALIKAKEIYKKTGEMVMADDSGLEVDFLGGAPGIYTSRYAGEGATDQQKNNKLLQALQGVPYEDRGARFVCTIAVVLSEGEVFVVRGTCEGKIATCEQGGNGFGYDPIFYVPEYDMTTAQMESELKHSISHRGRALRKMVEELEKRRVGC